MRLVNIIVWLDSTQAYVFLFNHEESLEKTVHAKHRNKRLLGAHALKAHERRAFFDEIEWRVKSGNEIVVVGPDDTKLDLVDYLKSKKSFRHRIIGVQDSDHANDADIHQLARKFFSPPPSMVHSTYVAGL